jgi:hypothetical protein
MPADHRHQAGGLLAARLREADYCAPVAKRPLEAKSCHAMPPRGGQWRGLLHRATCLTPWVSK